MFAWFAASAPAPGILFALFAAYHGSNVGLCLHVGGAFLSSRIRGVTPGSGRLDIRTRITREAIVLRWRRFGMSLYVGVFLYSLTVHIVFTAVPWQIMAIRGGEAPVEVGLAGGLYTGAYAIACLLLGPFAERIGLKRLAMLGTGITALVILALPAVPIVAVVLALFAAAAAVSSMFWPPVIGWISAGHENARLNRRLGAFNFSWCSALILGSVIGGLLFEVRYWLPFAVACGLSLGAFVWVATARKYHGPPRPADALDNTAEDAERAEHADLPAFHIMARIAMVTGWVAIGVLRFPLSTLLEWMSLKSGAYGLVVGGSSLAMLCAFTVMGLTHRWHYSRAFFWGCQVLGAALLGWMLFSRNVWDVALLVIPATLFASIVYPADLYYGVSGGKNRAASVSVHEILLAVGFAIGSFGGGLVARWLGPKAPFPVAAGVMILGVAAQVGIYIAYTRSRKSRKPSVQG